MTAKVPGFQPQSIRNVVLIGPSGAGKTTLAEAILHRCGAITRMGSVENETSAGDFEPEARARHHSTSSTVFFANYEGREINIVDTPGRSDLLASALSAIPAAETAILVVNAATGLEHSGRRLFHAAAEAGLARMIVVNQMDLARDALETRVAELVAAFGTTLHCLNLPASGGKNVIDCFDEDIGTADFGSVSKVHEEILESVVEEDDALTEQYLAGTKIPLPNLRRVFVNAMLAGHLTPILFTSAKSEIGVNDLLHVLAEEAPSPVSGRARRLLAGDELVEIPCEPHGSFVGHVFKVTVDPYLGQVAILRILRGSLGSATAFVVNRNDTVRTAGHVLKIEGREHPELETSAFAGDIVAIPRLEGIRVGDILQDPAAKTSFTLPPIPLPTPVVSLALICTDRKDEVKLMPALQHLSQEDPSLQIRPNAQSQEIIISGLGDLHLRVTLDRLRNRYHLAVNTDAPSIDYRETITRTSTGHYRHRKQSGGAGQFAEVFVRVEPLPRGAGIEFKSEVFGGAIPAPFIVSVEKGARDALESGSLGGYRVDDIRVVVTDGKTHPVDSKDIAFRTAGRMAVQDALARAMPVVLEPVASLEIQSPDDYMGAILADLKSRRGRVLGTEAMAGNASTVKAQAPVSELVTYAAQLRSLTAGTGSFTIEYSHLDVVPHAIQERLSKKC
jgi:elongation factor G